MSGEQFVHFRQWSDDNYSTIVTVVRLVTVGVINPLHINPLYIFITRNRTVSTAKIQKKTETISLLEISAVPVRAFNVFFLVHCWNEVYVSAIIQALRKIMLRTPGNSCKPTLPVCPVRAILRLAHKTLRKTSHSAKLEFLVERSLLTK